MTTDLFMRQADNKAGLFFSDFIEGAIPESDMFFAKNNLRWASYVTKGGGESAPYAGGKEQLGGSGVTFTIPAAAGTDAITGFGATYTFTRDNIGESSYAVLESKLSASEPDPESGMVIIHPSQVLPEMGLSVVQVYGGGGERDVTADVVEAGFDVSKMADGEVTMWWGALVADRDVSGTHYLPIWLSSVGERGKILFDGAHDGKISGTFYISGVPESKGSGGGCDAGFTGLFAMLFALAGEAVAAPSELVFVNFRDIRDLNPHLYAGEMYAQGILYDRLIDLTPSGYAPALAESWEVTDVGRTYTFKIREGVRFSDGEVCDAAAIKANFDAVLENRERHTWLEMMQLLESVEAPDKSTIRIRLSAPYYPMMTELAVTRPFAMISPKSMKNGSTKNGVESYVGTGPYKLTDFVRDEYAVFEVNELYWGKQPDIKKITVKVIPDNQTRILALEKGEIDLIYGKNMIDAEAINKYKDSGKFTVALSEPTSTRQIVLNTTNDILKDVSVRRALQHATDRKRISEGVFYGLEKPADTLFARTIPYCDIDLKPYEYSLEKAAGLLDGAGWRLSGSGKIREKDGKKLALSLLYNSNSVTEKTIAEYLQSEYAKLGLAVEIKGEEEQSYRDNMKAGNFDMVFNISWGTPYDPQSSLAAMRQRVYGDYAAQQGLPDKKEIDAAITKALVATDEKERQELFSFVLNRLHDEAVYIPITYECNKALFRSGLKNVTFSQSQYEIPFARMTF
jgi:nickel transport system substrate-binding protein